VGVCHASHEVRCDPTIEDAAIKARLGSRIGAVGAAAVARAYDFTTPGWSATPPCGGGGASRPALPVDDAAAAGREANSAPLTRD
jgi:hypothetical protein